MPTLEIDLELDKGLTVQGIGRFRVNVFWQRGEVAMVVRYLRTNIPTIDELNLPPLLNNFIMETRGLILIVGATGSGKSTTLASMIEHRNENKRVTFSR